MSEEVVSEPPPLDPTRRAWLSIGGRRCYFRINWTPDREVFSFSNPTVGAHEEYGQWWIGNTRFAVDQLRRTLRYTCRAEVIEVDVGGGPLPWLFLLELEASADPLEQAIFTLLLATPSERWRKMIRSLSASAHPDGVMRSRPDLADRLLEICNRLLDDPELQ